jgi:uncharacterized protein YukE
MSDHAQNDSERLERFRADLDRHRSMTRQGLDRINGSVSRLAGRWRDDQFKRFRHSFDRTAERLKAFLDYSAKQSTHLEELARASREIERGDLRGQS